MASPMLEALEQAAILGDERASIDLAQRLLSQEPLGSLAHERSLALLQQAAEGPRGLEAQWVLGTYFMMVTARPHAQEQAAHWLSRAANAGVAPAMDRMADLFLRGVGMSRSPGAALTWIQRLADRGFYRSAWDIGYLLDQGCSDAAPVAWSPRTAATAFARACALGYPHAYYSLGLRFAAGDGVARDRDFGRALLLRAVDGRFPDAQTAADALAPETACPGASSWHARLKQNLDAAQPLLERLRPSVGPTAEALNPLIPKLEAHLAEVGHPALKLDDSGRLMVDDGDAVASRRAPCVWDWLARQPRIAVVREFATREECAHLMNMVTGQLTEPRIYHGSGSANDDAELLQFTGRGCPIKVLQCDAVVRCLEQRLAKLTDWPAAAMEPCSIIRYEAGQEYQPHVDYFTDDQIKRNRKERQDFSGQRVATFLLYLRAPGAGGETEYLRAGVRVRGERGMGVLHYNVTPDGVQDNATLHSGTAIVRGEKWLWRSTLRERPL